VIGARGAAADRPLSWLHAALLSERFVVTAEIGPPRGATLAPIQRKAKLLGDWVDAANVTDNQSATVPGSSR
jgi:methylenetetrahydrofolate reductase (NADPH)